MPKHPVSDEPMPDWPALMPLTMAARYLSMDEASFLALCRERALDPVEPLSGLRRWRRIDIDMIVSRLASSPVELTPGRATVPARAASISDADIERIVGRVREFARAEPEVYSIKDASRVVGLSRSTMYNLIQEGRLIPVRVGSRTLIRRSELEALLQGSASGGRN